MVDEPLERLGGVDREAMVVVDQQLDRGAAKEAGAVDALDGQRRRVALLRTEGCSRAGQRPHCADRDLAVEPAVLARRAEPGVARPTRGDEQHEEQPAETHDTVTPKPRATAATGRRAARPVGITKR